MRDSLIKLMPWMGGKGQLMWAIQMLLPIHYKTLVDVFGGSGIITLNTAVPKGCLQIYNDLNHDLYMAKRRIWQVFWLTVLSRPKAMKTVVRTIISTKRRKVWWPQ